MNRKILFLILLSVILNILGCNKKNIDIKEKSIIEKFNKIEEDIIIESNNAILESNLTVWVVYWDTNINQEIEEYDEYIDAISYFAADFNLDNKVIFREKSKALFDKYKDNGKKKILSIVNDKILEDGSSVIKDINILKELYSSDNNIDHHINDIVEIVKKNKFDVVEIDYEQLKSDIELWNMHLDFLGKLYKKLTSINVDLRVLLEPNFPVEELEFFEGPVYVMMCYNLHGGFSEPGEKSNKEFIKELIVKMEDIPGRKDFAIPTGGFEWSSNGEVCQINEKKAEEKLDKFNGERVRDKSSGYLVGKYKDYKNIEHEIWYADKETLEILAEPIVEKGYDISIWRLDGK